MERQLDRRAARVSGLKRGRFHTHFAAQERRALSLACVATLYAAEPDVVLELLAIARDLMHPAAPLDREERIVWTIQAGRRLEKLAKRIEAIKPGAEFKQPTQRRLPGRLPPPAKRLCGAQKRPERQFEMQV